MHSLLSHSSPHPKHSLSVAGAHVGSSGGGSCGVSGIMSAAMGSLDTKQPPRSLGHAEHRSTAAGVIQRQDADALSGRAMQGDDHPAPTDCA
eukprot:CAMPEP_0185452998 /NCGR_PEP_ID=MMETSP1365-20130426/68742_1 /TAXON_ID=38817 /ORGANISM="Gephyrocapsa oceanica, Strain RCC1303" /LENGTH=91 /DNA_ID=CAMNT_0028059225 /DNA_START=42 /DNA_END=314 /DNA_ORIENTATION=-